MYELTTLKPPFNAFNLAGLVAKIKRAALPPIPAGYSADWAGVLKRWGVAGAERMARAENGRGEYIYNYVRREGVASGSE